MEIVERNHVNYFTFYNIVFSKEWQLIMKLLMLMDGLKFALNFICEIIFIFMFSQIEYSWILIQCNSVLQFIKERMNACYKSVLKA